MFLPTQKKSSFYTSPINHHNNGYSATNNSSLKGKATLYLKKSSSNLINEFFTNVGK